jgi:hypothetical protein
MAKYLEIIENNVDCETEDRFSSDCPAITSLVQYTADLERFANLGHLFYGAPDCATGVLGFFIRSEFLQIALTNSDAIHEEEEMDEELSGGSGSATGMIVIVLVIAVCMGFLCFYGGFRLYKTLQEHAKMKMESLEKHKEEVEASDSNQNDQFLGNVNLSLYNNEPILADFDDSLPGDTGKVGKQSGSAAPLPPSTLLGQTALGFTVRKELGQSGINFAERIAQNKTGQNFNPNRTSSWNTGTKTTGFYPRKSDIQEDIQQREEPGGRQNQHGDTTLNESLTLNESSMFLASGDQPVKLMSSATREQVIKEIDHYS